MNKEITKEDVNVVQGPRHQCNIWCKPPRHCQTFGSGGGVTFEIQEALCRDWCKHFNCEFVSLEPAPEAPPVVVDIFGLADDMWLMTWIDNDG